MFETIVAPGDGPAGDKFYWQEGSATPSPLVCNDYRRRSCRTTEPQPWERSNSLVYRSNVATVGTFRCPRDHPRFGGGATDSGLVVFPRTTVVIERERSGPVIADPNTIVFYEPGEHYHRRGVDRRGDRCDYFSVTDELAEELSAIAGPGAARRSSLLHLTHGPASPRLYPAQRRLVEALLGEVDVDPLWVDELAVRIVAHAIHDAGPQRDRDKGSAATWRRHASVVLRAKQVMADLACGPLHLMELADEVAVSPFHLSRLVRRHTGFTVHEYVTQLRLRRALERLRTDVDLATLALELGFSSHSHFTSVFRSVFGWPPSVERLAATDIADLGKILTV